MAIDKSILDIAQNESIQGNYKDLFTIIAEKNKGGIGDSCNPHSIGDVQRIADLQHEIIKTNIGSGNYRTLEDVQKSSVMDVELLLKDIQKRDPYKVPRDVAQSMGVGDAYFNDVLGMGTGIDPTMYAQSFVPIALSPYEGASLYSNGGLAQVIIDKKAKGLQLNGFEFEGQTVDDAKKLKEHAIKTKFDQYIPIVNALIYGGGIQFPIFKNDSLKTNGTMMLSLDELIEKGICGKDQIERWVETDRWNTVMIPRYNIAAADYLLPQSVYIPISSLRVNTDRTALVRPTKLPYWATIFQLGWSTSDFVGYIKDLYDYTITIMTIPIMFQQQSLLFSLLPLDAALLVGGMSSGAQSIADYNAAQLAKSSLLNPGVLNSVGDIKVIDRAFTGVEPLIKAMRQNLCAKAKLQETVVFDTQSTGFSDNKESMTLKQTEAVKMLGNSIAPQLDTLVKILVIDCFGANSEQSKKFTRITFNPSLVLSEGEKAEKGLKLAQFLQYMINAKFTHEIAVNSAKQYFNYEISEKDMAEVKKIKPEEDNKDGIGAKGHLNPDKNHNLGKTDKDKPEKKE